MKWFVSTAMWPLVELGRGDDMGTMIRCLGAVEADPQAGRQAGRGKKLDTDTRGRDKTKAQTAPHSNKGGQSPGHQCSS